MPVYQRVLRGPDGKIVRDALDKPVPWLDKRGRPRWSAQVYVGRNRTTGKVQFLTKTFRREKDAQQWARSVETRKDKGDRPTTDRRTVAEYMDWWLAMKATGAVSGKKKGKAPRARTMSDYRRAVERWILHPPKGLPLLGACRLDRLTYETLDAFYDAMVKDAGTTAGTVQGLHGVLRQALEEPARNGSLPRNPTDWASVPQVGVPSNPGHGEEPEYDGESIKAMDEAQAARFLAAARELEREGCFAALWHVLLQTGLRPGEAFALMWKDVDEQAKTVQVRRNLVRIPGVKRWTLERPKTKNSVRTVPLPALALRELKAWRARQKWQQRVAGDSWEEHDFVFTTRNGTPLHGARRSFERVTAKAELGEWGEEPQRKHGTGPLPARQFKPAFRIYDLRHTCITLWLKAGVLAHVASKLAGHATAAFTLTRYAHALPDQKLEAAEKMDAIFGTA
jgi:integrase